VSSPPRRSRSQRDKAARFEGPETALTFSTLDYCITFGVRSGGYVLAAQHYGRVFSKTDSNDRITIAGASPQ
jgi:hypothetical protein